MHDTDPDLEQSGTMSRPVPAFTSRGAMIVCAIFMLSWLMFLVSGIIYFQAVLD